tara:strand:- start:252 stop:470 length:219 start_codon:yes stop_codon:yes gene_type:complete
MFRVWFEHGSEAMTVPPVGGTFESRGAAHAALHAAGYVPFGKAGPDPDGDDQWENENNLDSAYQFAEVLTSS